MRPLLLLAVLGVSCCAAGCANLESREVPLCQRLADCDGGYKGFRYYLSRPYLLVNRKTVLLSHNQVGELMQRTDATSDACDKYAIRVVVPGAKCAPQVVWYDLAGNVKTVERPWEWDSVRHESDQRVQPLALTSGNGEDTPLPFGGQTESDVEETSNNQKKPWYETAPAPASPGAAAAEEFDDIQVVYLPDFEEQMVVKPHNFLAHCKYKLVFEDGWQLKLVNGSFDSTEVPVKILQTLQKAITAQAALDEQRIKTKASGASTNGAQASEPTDKSKERQARRVLITRTRYLDPDLYRLKKSSEMDGACSAGLGILADMGIPVMEDVSVRLLADPTLPKGASAGEKKDQENRDASGGQTVWENHALPLASPLSKTPDVGGDENHAAGVRETSRSHPANAFSSRANASGAGFCQLSDESHP